MYIKKTKKNNVAFQLALRFLLDFEFALFAHGQREMEKEIM